MTYSRVIPKENPARRNKHQELTLERRTDDTLIGPELSSTINWHPKTREWWDTWRRAPIAPILESTDWEELESTALLHHHVWSGRLSVAMVTNALAEIRQRVSKLGATYEDRLKLRIKFADASMKEDEANPPVTSKNYRKMLEGDK